MKFLVDAHISQEMVAMMRGLGHDCLASSPIPARMQDVDVLRMAEIDRRIVVTADKDFAELVFVHAIACPTNFLLGSLASWLLGIAFLLATSTPIDCPSRPMG